jgi:hypothetical protein
MSRHGKSKSKSRSDKQPRRPSRADESAGDAQLAETPRKSAVKPSKPRKSLVAAEATGALPREDVVRQEPAAPTSRAAAPARAPEPEPQAAAESAVDSWQRSLQAARLGTVEVNRMLVDIGRRNFASGLDFARSLATARTPIEAVRLQLAFFDERMKTLLHQAEALRALSADLVARANEPIRAQIRRGLRR